MSRNNTRTTNPSARSSEKKLRTEIEQLETAVNKIPLLQQHKSPELADLAEKLGRLHKNKPLFRNNPRNKTSSTDNTTLTDRINREDATLRGTWLQDPFGASAPVDSDWSDEERDTGLVESDGCRGGWGYGVLGESPERPGPRFHTPIWVRNRNQRHTFGQRLLRNYKKEHPTLANFVKSKAATQTQILFDYFVEHVEYAELYDKYRQPKNDIYVVSTKDAKTVQEAIEYSAEKNGTFAAFEEGGNVPWDLGEGVTELVTTFWFDNAEHKFKLVTARKVNAEIFRVELHNEVEDGYYLPEKLDPSKKESTRPLQRYIEDLVCEGYKLLKIAKPDANVRATKRKVRQAEEDAVIARNQLGGGTSAIQYEHTSTLPDQSYMPSQAATLNAEYGRAIAAENVRRETCRVAHRRIETQGMSPAEIATLDECHVEMEYADLMARLNPNSSWPEEFVQAKDKWMEAKLKSPQAKARFDRVTLELSQPPALIVKPAPVSSPVAQSEPAAPPATPTVSHEVFRLSLVCFLAGLVQGRQSNPPWHPRIPGRGGVHPA